MNIGVKIVTLGRDVEMVRFNAFSKWGQPYHKLIALFIFFRPGLSFYPTSDRLMPTSNVGHFSPIGMGKKQIGFGVL